MIAILTEANPPLHLITFPAVAIDALAFSLTHSLYKSKNSWMDRSKNTSTDRSPFANSYCFLAPCYTWLLAADVLVREKAGRRAVYIVVTG